MAALKKDSTVCTQCDKRRTARFWCEEHNATEKAKRAKFAMKGNVRWAVTREYKNKLTRVLGDAGIEKEEVPNE